MSAKFFLMDFKSS